MRVGTGMDSRGSMKITGKRSVTWEGVRDRRWVMGEPRGWVMVSMYQAGWLVWS